jgi:hypothetical protein
MRYNVKNENLVGALMTDLQLSDSWAVAEFGDAELNDPRRIQRLIEIATLLAAQPQASFPQACGDKAMLKATYRFFDNDQIDPQQILESHINATSERISAVDWVLAIQDTTELNFSHHPATENLGPLSGWKARGLLAHTTLAMTPDRVPLGIIAQQVWARDPSDVGKKARRKSEPIENKESYKWIVGLNRVIEMGTQHPNTHFVNIADRESDVYDLFIVDRPENVDLLIRASWNRRVAHEEKYLFNHVEVQPVAKTITVEIPRRASVPARPAHLEIRFCPLTLCPPKHRKAENLRQIEVFAVYAVEPNPPAGIEPIEWLLLTTLEVATVSSALDKIEAYACRWGIEVLHKVLKSGLRIEDRQLQQADRLHRCLTVFSVIAWRILYATMLCRTVPDAPCTALLDPDEWQALFCRIHQNPTLPQQPPTLNEAVGWIAQLGGFLGRNSDGQPGVTVLWKGFLALTHLTAMYRILRPPPLE